MHLEVRLFGFFQLTCDSEPLSSLNQPRLQSILAYLILHAGTPIPRQHLAFLFWPDLSEAQARNNLRQGLHQLRQLLPAGDQLIFTDPNTVQWRPEPAFFLDVAEFQQALTSARSGLPGERRQALEQALALYRGDLLPACYDDWILPEREKLHQACLQALEALSQLLEEQRRFAEAIPFAQRLVQHDRLYEPGYRLLMRLYALNEDRAAALRTYHACTDLLQQELGVEPEAATYQAYLGLLNRSGQVGDLHPRQASAARLPLVGRQPAWAQLQGIWQRVRLGGPEIVLLEGEAGIGKSRLAEELLEWAALQGYTTAKTRAFAAEGNLSYEPLTHWLRSEACRPVYARLERTWLTETARLLPELLLEFAGLPAPGPLRENWQRQRFFQGLAHTILGMRQPVILLIDDLQWCDPETLEWLHYLLRVDLKARLLLVATIRAEELATNPALQAFLADLRRGTQATEIWLDPLDAAETAHLARHLAGREIEDQEALRLFRETEGNPLFVLETLRSGVPFLAGHAESPAGPAASGLPARVQQVIADRLRRLSAAGRALAGLAATIGRSFDYELLLHASQAQADDLNLWLDELWQHRIVRELGGESYDFSHDKLREVAYAQASPPRRRQYHRQVARALESLNAPNLDPLSSQIANHLELAGSLAQAIPYYHRAAVVAQRVGATEEAISLLQKALALLDGLKPGPPRDAAELEIQTALAVCLVDGRGHGAPEVLQVFQTAQAICERLGQPLSPPILRGLGLCHIGMAHYRQSLDFGERLLQLGRTQADPVLGVEGDYLCGASLIWLGEFARAREKLEAALAAYLPGNSAIHISLFSQDPRVICLSRLGYVLWCQGYPDQARALSRQALAYGWQCGHPFSLAYAMLWNVILLGQMGCLEEARQGVNVMAAYCREQQLAFWLPQAEALSGWMRAECGEPESGIALLRRGMDDFWATGSHLQRPMFLTFLALEKGKAGQPGEGLELVQEALELTRQQEEHWFEAEILRCQGELLVLTGAAAPAELAFQQAGAVAAGQGALGLQLRAALGLALLWLGQGKPQAAYQTLAPLSARFSEGLDLPDLQAAHRLLGQAGPVFTAPGGQPGS